MGIIYQITNLINSKKYIGKTLKTLERRKKNHLYSVKYGSKTYLHKAIRKNGIDNFKFEIIEETDLINEREKYWIEEFKPEYNMTNGGDGGDTSESPNFIDYLKNLDRRGSKNPMYGKRGKDNPNFGQQRGNKILISLGQKRNWDNNPKRKENARLKAIGNKHGYNNKKQSKPIMVNGIKYNSIGQAAIATGLSRWWVLKEGILL